MMPSNHVCAVFQCYDARRAGIHVYVLWGSGQCQCMSAAAVRLYGTNTLCESTLCVAEGLSITLKEIKTDWSKSLVMLSHQCISISLTCLQAYSQNASEQIFDSFLFLNKTLNVFDGMFFWSVCLNWDQGCVAFTGGAGKTFWLAECVGLMLQSEACVKVLLIWKGKSQLPTHQDWVDIPSFEWREEELNSFFIEIPSLLWPLLQMDAFEATITALHIPQLLSCTQKKCDNIDYLLGYCACSVISHRCHAE